MNFELRQKLASVAGRIRSLRLWSGLALCWLAWAAVGAVLFKLAVAYGWDKSSLWPRLAVLAAVTAVAWVIVVFRSARDQRAVARRVEAQHPELATLLLAAVEVASSPRTPGKGPSFLQATVLREALEHGRSHNWTDAVSPWKLRAAKLAQFVALGLLIGVCLGLAGRGGALAGSAASLLSGRGLAGGDFAVTVDPGDVEIERGTSLLVVAEFAHAVPPDVMLVVASGATSGDAAAESAHKNQMLSMVRSLDDPKFVGRVPAVASDLTYHVEFAGHKSDTYRVTVFDYPELVRVDAELVFPKYTSLDPTVVEDVRHVTAVEGTRLTLVCRLNKEVAEARLLGKDDEKIELKQDADDKKVYRTSWTLAKSQRFKLQLVDRDGRGSRLPAEIVVNVTPNRPPKIALERPGRDVEVSPLEELQLQATVTDDFGIERYGLSYALGGDESREIVLAAEAKPQAADKLDQTARPKENAVKQRNVDYIVDFETLAVEPDQLLSYFVWAEDFGPDGKLRRTMNDMYFAEVRPFEEIYRQGEQPSESEQQQREQQQQGEGGAAQEAGELADLQKEIINATWRLIRREMGTEPTAEFAGDSRLVAESQQSAIDKLSELAQRIEDAESQAHVDAAATHMSEALKQLTASADGPAVAPLRPALAAEQSAYQALLKLRAREFQVVRGARQQQSGRMASRSSRSQRQLQQLELSNEENRYETQRSATAPQENQAQRESREILNRLKDLARRQDDLNERLRELQSALQQADSTQRREDLERELKRLRDQQQEILRDTDELMSRMDQSQNQQAAQDAREQMQDGRSHVQQASEALDEGQLSQALTEGTRAGRQLGEVRDQFRQQAANQFSEEMTDMRRAARNLDQQQEQLSQQLTEQNNEVGRSLRDTGNRAEAQEGLAQERRDLNELLERMQRTIEQAEQPEPLLARQLYDTVRETHQQRVDDALSVTQRLLEVGIEREANQSMRTAGQGIRNLRQGVERAAENVLGDEGEALRRAQQEVNRLADELNREIAQARGGEAPGEQNEQPTQQKQGGQSGRQQGRSQSGQNEQRPDQQREGQQQSEGQSGEKQQGQAQNDARQEQNGNGRGGGEVRERQSLRGGGESGADRRVGVERFLEGGGRGAPGGPITGEDLRQWSDRIGDIQEMLDDPELRSEAARIRDRAADARAEFKRHAKVPDWTKLHDLVAEPLNELSRRIGEEIRRRESPDSLVPIDRDPVPPEFSDGVRRYYERLGSGE